MRRTPMRTGPSERFNKGLNNALGGSPINEITEKSLKKASPDDVEIDEKGGWGSGHFGHSGRPPKVGGSRPGGVKVGRAEMADAASHFKFSGKDKLRSRPGGKSVSVAVRPGKGDGLLSSSGIMGKNGKTARGKIRLSVPGGKSIKLGFKQLHDLRSKARFMHTANVNNVDHIGGKKVARGDSIEVSDGENTITIPIDEKTLEELDHATKSAIGRGEGSVTWLAENAGMVQELAKEFGNHTDPFKYLNEKLVTINGRKQPISLAGRYAILHYYVMDRHEGDPRSGKMTRESVKRRMRANIAKYPDKPGHKAAMNKLLAEYDKAKDEAVKRLTERSGTQSMVESLEKAAALKFRLIGGSQPRSGRKKKKGAPKEAPKPKAPKAPKAEKPVAEKPVAEAPKPSPLHLSQRPIGPSRKRLSRRLRSRRLRSLRRKRSRRLPLLMMRVRSFRSA
jgi:hypothetical protein